MFFYLRPGEKIDQQPCKHYIEDPRQHHRLPGEGGKRHSLESTVEGTEQLTIEILCVQAESRAGVLQMNRQNCEQASRNGCFSENIFAERNPNA